MPGWRSLSICVVMLGALLLWAHADVQASLDFPINDPGIETAFATMTLRFATLGFAGALILSLAILLNGILWNWHMDRGRSRYWRGWRQDGKFLLVGLMPLFLLVWAPFALTYSGFCMSQVRYVPDEEKIRSAVGRLLVQRTRPNSFYEPGHPPQTAIGVFSGVDDLLAANPNCCNVGIYGGDMPAPTYYTRLLGVYSDVVRIRYAETLIDQTGFAGMQQVVALVGFDVCGEIKVMDW